MVLYHAISTYQILEISLHRMKFHKQDKAILLLPDFIVKKHKDYFRLVQLGIFDEVYLCPYLQIPHEEEYIRENLECIFKQNIPYELESFRTVYVAGIHFYFSLLLIKKGIKFSAFEDAAGMIGDGEKIYQELNQKYPIHATIAKKNGLFNYENEYIKEVIVQQRTFSVKKHQVIFNVEREIKKTAEHDLEKILQFFRVDMIRDNVADKDLLLTERYSVIGTMLEEEQIDLYQFVVNKYLNEEQLIIKPHPDETICYKEIFPKAKVLSGNFPSELIPIMFRFGPRAIWTFNSTAVSTLQRHYKIKHFDLKKIQEEKNENSRRNSGKI